MPIGPVTNSHMEISVVEPVSPALERAKRMLFKPFNPDKWFTIGFCAWLALLGESGGGLHGNFGGGNGSNNNSSGQPEEHFRHFYDQARDFTINNLYWIIPVAAAAILLMV